MIRLKARGIPVNPIDSLRCQPLNYVKKWTSPTTKKEESPYLQAWPVPGILMLQLSAAKIARAILKKEVVVATSSYARRSLKNGEASHSGKLFNPTTNDWWNPEIRPAVSPYFFELLIQKCKFRHQVVASTLCLDKHSPRGSCHLDESSMNHTLAQKHLCEFWCGMHRTCKNTSVKPDRTRLMTRVEKQSERIHSTSLLEATLPSKPNRGLPFVRHGGFWVGHFPVLKIEMIKQVHQGDQPRLPPSCIASLACVCMMAACPLLEKTWNNADKNQEGKLRIRSFTSVQMFHTHTNTHLSWLIPSVLNREVSLPPRVGRRFQKYRGNVK